MKAILNLVSLELYAWAAALIALLPGQIGRVARHGFYWTRLAGLGARSNMASGLFVIAPERIRIGRRFATHRDCSLIAAEGGRLELGDDVHLGSNVILDAGVGGLIQVRDGSSIGAHSVFRSSMKNYSDSSRPFQSQGHTSGTIIVEEDVWIGAHCVVLAGSHIEKGAIIEAGSLVNGRIKSYSVAAGRPAAAIGKR